MRLIYIIVAAMVQPSLQCANMPGDSPCGRAVVQAMTHGFARDPEQFVGLTIKSSYTEFQAYFHNARMHSCPRPCLPQEQACVPWSASFPGMAKIGSMRKEMVRHPNWYPELSSQSSDEEIAQVLYTRGTQGIPRVCQAGEEAGHFVDMEEVLSEEAQSDADKVKEALEAAMALQGDDGDGEAQGELYGDDGDGDYKEGDGDGPEWSDLPPDQSYDIQDDGHIEAATGKEAPLEAESKDSSKDDEKEMKEAEEKDTLKEKEEKEKKQKIAGEEKEKEQEEKEEKEREEKEKEEKENEKEEKEKEEKEQQLKEKEKEEEEMKGEEEDKEKEQKKKGKKEKETEEKEKEKDEEMSGKDDEEDGKKETAKKEEKGEVEELGAGEEPETWEDGDEGDSWEVGATDFGDAESDQGGSWEEQHHYVGDYDDGDDAWSDDGDSWGDDEGDAVSEGDSLESFDSDRGMSAKACFHKGRSFSLLDAIAHVPVTLHDSAACKAHCSEKSDLKYFVFHAPTKLCHCPPGEAVETQVGHEFIGGKTACEGTNVMKKVDVAVPQLPLAGSEARTMGLTVLALGGMLGAVAVALRRDRREYPRTGDEEEVRSLQLLRSELPEV